MFPTYVGLSHKGTTVCISSVPVSLPVSVVTLSKLKWVKLATSPTLGCSLFNFLLKEEALEYLICQNHVSYVA